MTTYVKVSYSCYLSICTNVCIRLLTSLGQNSLKFRWSSRLVLYTKINLSETFLKLTKPFFCNKTYPRNTSLNSNLWSQTATFLRSTIILQRMSFQCKQFVSIETVKLFNDPVGKSFCFQPLFHFCWRRRLLYEYFRCFHNIQNTTFFSE